MSATADTYTDAQLVKLRLTPEWPLIGKFDGEFAGSAQAYASCGTLQYTC